ncbi:T9SS type A sorting domain-containing protein [Neolewinella persica]|uniref:T9SS type A sorting domain-containing protein n=1 Tax=Neolewinella persica TaxID=70998 RepID=UPI000366DD9B|nr:T9SS type A sorting domain-containing protein [Neolewinella persica]
MRIFTLLFALSVLILGCEPVVKEVPRLLPIEIGADGEADGEEKENARERWEAAIHRAAPGTDWRKLEARNAMARHRKRRNAPGRKAVETFADGLLLGEWFERGSKYTAGSIHDVVQDPTDPNNLFIMSAGGAIWQMDYDKEEFALVNHDIYFSEEYLGLVPTMAGRNLIAFTENRPMYSTDDGDNWEYATVRRGNDRISGDQLTNFFSPLVADSTMLTTLQIDNGRYEIFRSRNGGTSYSFIKQPPFTTAAGDQTITHLYRPPGVERTFVLMKKMFDDPQITLYEMKEDAAGIRYDSVANLAIATTGSFRARLSAAKQPGTDSLRIFMQADDQLFRSDDDGVSWREMPMLEKKPWRNQAIYVRPSDPDFVAYGAVELWVSRDGGETFTPPNFWWEYYDDITKYLHADIMRLTEITDSEGAKQMLVSSHGGLNRLDPSDGMWYNVANEGLNVAQYYDVRTNPGDPDIIYAGSQDQGFQILEEDETSRRDILGGFQDFSGDYGHLAFAERGNVFFTAYPFGSIYAFYDVLSFGGFNEGWSNYRIESPDEFTWITPMMSPPTIGGNVELYVAGGSADTAKSGSYLVQVTLDRDIDSGNFGKMTGQDKPFDFIDAGAGNLSAMTYSPINPDRFYVATTEGRFFTSTDRGDSWTETLNFLPDGWYLYGQAIHASKTEEETVWLGGSGYSNPPVWRSTDGGENFFPASEGLPPTIVHGLTANATETLLFAATEAGPFVYVVDEERWYDLAGQFAPTMRYYSVEFLDDRNLARFGTYGRGAWDFQVEELVPTDEPFAVSEQLKIYPNPASVAATIEGAAVGYRVYDIAGREVVRVKASPDRTRLSLAGVRPGLYFVQPLDADGRAAGLGQRLIVN